MRLRICTFELSLTHAWTIAGRPPQKGKTIIFVELDNNGVTGIGEAAPVARYSESTETVLSFLKKVDSTKLSFDRIAESMAYLDGIAPNNASAKGAINIALLDGAAKKAGKPIYDFIGLGFTENKHVTSFTIGIDTPEVVRQKVLEAEQYPVLKLKVGSPNDQQNFAMLREVAPNKTVRIDANEGWATKEEALSCIEWFAKDKHIEFIEQPMPATSNPKDLAWLKERSPMPVYADESYISAKDVSLCADCYHGVNVKLLKTGGISGGFEALQAAKKAGLQRMIGCMVESSAMIAAAGHLAELSTHLDIDTNLLLANDPFLGTTAPNGIISFADAPEKTGLRVKARTNLKWVSPADL